MKWTPKDPVCEVCVNRNDSPSDVSDRGSSCRSGAAATTIMQIKKIIVGDSWKMRKAEVFVCSTCKCEYVFPRYGEILKIAENKTGVLRCTSGRNQYLLRFMYMYFCHSSIFECDMIHFLLF